MEKVHVEYALDVWKIHQPESSELFLLTSSAISSDEAQLLKSDWLIVLANEAVAVARWWPLSLKEYQMNITIRYLKSWLVCTVTTSAKLSMRDTEANFVENLQKGSWWFTDWLFCENYVIMEFSDLLQRWRVISRADPRSWSWKWPRWHHICKGCTYGCFHKDRNNPQNVIITSWYLTQITSSGSDIDFSAPKSHNECIKCPKGIKYRPHENIMDM